MDEKTDKFVKSARRTLEVLEYMRDSRSGSVSDICAYLNIPQSSTSMLLKTLVQLGYLSYNPVSRRFKPTYRVALLGAGIERCMFPEGPLADILPEIQRQTGETVLLGLRNGPCAQYIYVLNAPHGLQLTAQVGQLRPMAYTAVGKCLLSQLSTNVVRAICRRNNAEWKDVPARITEEQLLEEIDSIRRLGYAESKGSMLPRASVIAMPIYPYRGGQPMAIGVGGPIDRIEANRNLIISELKEKLKAYMGQMER